MLLAGNGSSATGSKTVPSTQIQAPIAPITGPVPVDDLNGSGRSSMLSFSAVPSNVDQRRVKTLGAYDTPIRRPETPRAITSLAPARRTIFPAGMSLYHSLKSFGGSFLIITNQADFRTGSNR